MPLKQHHKSIGRDLSPRALAAVYHVFNDGGRIDEMFFSQQ
jgi:hypothetical protein